VISNNRTWNPGNSRQALKLHSPIVNDGVWGWSSFVTITDNLVKGSVWSMALGSEDTVSDERPEQVLVERNRFYGDAATVDIMIHSSNVLVRNNVMTTAMAGYTGVWVVHIGNLVPMESNIRVLDNTVYATAASPGGGLAAVAVGTWSSSAAAGPTGVQVRNNLLATVATSGYRVAVDTTGTIQGGAGPGAGYLGDHNVVTATPLFTNAAAGDFSLLPGTPAVDAGVTLGEVRQDFRRAPRPLGLSADAGAFESH
jgi:hypothetical protein